MTASPDQTPAPRLAALNLTDHPERGSQVGIVAKRTYTVRAGRCLIADEQVALVENPRLTDDDASLLHDLDIVLNRRQADVIGLGKARAPRKTRSFEVRVRVGSLDRRVFVFGDRRCWRAADGGLHFTDAEPTDEIDLDWTSAYGGLDEASLKMNGDPFEAFYTEAKQPYHPRFGLYTYPRNRVGKGYLVDASPEALEACSLPNLEEPLALLTPETIVVGRAGRWPAAPLVAGFGWLSYGWFPRMAQLGMPPPFDAALHPPTSFREVTLGVLHPNSIAPAIPLQKRLDLAAAQQSAVGMRVPEIVPGSDVEFMNIHRQSATWAFALPREIPTLALQMPGERPRLLEPKIRTLLIEPELDRLCLVWVGEHREPVPVGPGKHTQ